MDQLTLRDIDDELRTRICRLADREGISPDEMVLRLVRKGVGLTEQPEGSRTIGNSLDNLFGTWTKEEADEFDAAVKEMCEAIDVEKWL